MKNWGDLSPSEKDKIIKEYKNGKTAPDIAKEKGISLTSMRTPLHREHRKADHGGARKNSGNKKGVEFCPTCRKKVGNCSHTKKD